MKYLIALAIFTCVGCCSVEPNTCTCYKRKTLAYCVDRNMSRPPTFPRRTASHIKYLNLIGNKLQYLTNGYIRGFSALAVVDIRAQRVPVNCTLLAQLRHKLVIRSDCSGLSSNISSFLIVTEKKPKEPDTPTIPVDILRNSKEDIDDSTIYIIIGVCCVLAFLTVTAMSTSALHLDNVHK